MDIANPKEMSADVAAAGKRPGNWYTYFPEYAPGFCLMTQRDITWEDPLTDFGHWRARHPDPPHRILMEAHGHRFTLRRRYMWDGMTWGCTRERDLMPSLLHDALYHALQGGAPVSRRAVDRAFLRTRRAQKVGDAYGEYLAVRWFGGLYNKPRGGHPTIVVELLPEP